jgi:hypothetical protein
MRGFLVPDPRLGCDDLAVNDGSAVGSSYSQTGPRPGTSSTSDPLSRVIPFILGAQSRDLEVEFVAAGDPGIEPDAARLVWRFAGDAASEVHGYTDPNWSTVWTSVLWNQNGTETGTNYGSCVHPQSQRVIVVARYDLGTPDEIWSARSVGIDGFERAGDVDVGVYATTGAGSLGVCALPSGRLLAFQNQGFVYYSDDVASSWSLYARQAFAFSLPTPRIAAVAATAEGEVLLLVDHQNGELSQWASRNLGATFEPVEENAAIGENPSICILPSGRICIVYADSPNGQGRSRTIASPFDPISSATERTITTDFGDEMAAAVDGRGWLWAFHGGVSMRVYRSVDEGATWTRGEYHPFDGATGNREADAWQAVAARGFVWLIHRPLDGPVGSRNEALGAFRLGGWSNLEPFNALIAGEGFYQRSWVDYSGDYFHRTYFPSGEPSAAGFTHNGAVNGVVDSITNFGKAALLIDTAIGQDGWYSVVVPGGGVSLYAQVTIGDPPGFPPGGNALAPYCGIRVDARLGGSSSQTEFRIFGSGSEVRFRVHDLVAGVDVYDAPLGGVNIPRPRLTGSEPFLELYFLQTAGNSLPNPRLFLYFRRSDRVRWTYAGQIELVATAGGGNGLVEFGNLTIADVSSSRVASVWRALNIAGGAVGGPAANGPSPAGLLADRDLLRGAQIGTNALELVGVGELDVDEAALGVRGGPATFGEIHSIPVIHDFPIRSLFWDCSPSRSEVWRSTDDGVEQVLAFEFPEQTRIGGSFLLGLFVAGANFPTARLEVDTVGGGAGWTTVATLNLAEGFENLGFERFGDVLRPGAAPVKEGERFLNRAELVGGVARWGAGGSSGVARIVNQSAGGWTDKATNTIQPFARVDAELVAGTSTAGNNLDLQAPAGLVVAHLDESVGLLYGVRVVVEATSTPEGYHEAGLLMVGAVTPFGQQWSRGYSVETSPNASRSTSTFGTIRKTQLGPPPTRFSVAWPDGVKLHQMRQGIDVDYLGPAGKPPAVADHDVWGQLWGLLDETKSGELPVVIVARLPPDNFTVTDRTLFAFASLDGSARFDHVLGDEGVDEFGRLAGIEASEIK